MSKDASNFPIKIYARQRPAIPELESKGQNAISWFDSREVVLTHGFNVRRFKFDHAFNENTKQAEVFSAVVAPMVTSMIAGYDCTVFVYGQTGSGKSHTMFGPLVDNGINNQPPDDKGIILQVASQLFTELIQLNPKIEYTVRISFVEIYNECVYDLLNDGTALRMYDDPSKKGSVFMRDLLKVTVVNSIDVCDWINIGLAQLYKSSADVNQRTSRAHTIFTFNIDLREVSSKSEETIKSGKLQLVDLAGSENITRVVTSEIRNREGVNVNRSIITFHKVIRALSQKMQHIPYRDSKLTRILQDSLGGSSKTAMIATFIANTAVWDETINSLELTQLAKTIINSPVVNVNKRQASLFNEMKTEITKLKQELAAARSGEGFYVSTEAYIKMSEDVEKNNKKILELIRDIREMEDVRVSMERQQKDLVKSFEETKAYLETMRKELEAKRDEAQQAELVVHELAKKREKLTKTANALLHVCEDSTKHEDIYHKKLQDKYNANQNNIETSEEMTNLAGSAMLQCLKVIEGNVALRKDCAEKSMSLASFILEENENVVQGLNELSCDITDHFPRSYLTMHKALGASNNKDSITNIHKVISETYEKSLINLKEQTIIKDNLLANKDKLDAILAELHNRSFDFFENIQKSCENKKHNVEVYSNIFGEINHNLTDLEKDLSEKLTKSEATLHVLSEQVREAKEEEDKLISDIAHWEKQLSLLYEATQPNALSLSEEPCVTKSIDFLRDLNDVVNAQKAVIDSDIKDIDNYELAASINAKSNQENITEYTNEMVQKINEYFDNKVVEHKANLSIFEDLINDLVCCIPDAKNDKATILTNLIDDMQRSLEIQNSEGDVIITETQERNKYLNGRICHMGHIGDTPAKRDYRYPQSVDESFNESVENLEETADTDNQ